MKYFFIHDANGQIHNAGQCADDELEIQQVPEGMMLQEGEANPFTSYFDGENVTVKPARPTDRHVFDWMQKQWIDPRTLADLKAEKWTQFKRSREAAAVAPLMTTRFGIFDAAPKDMANIKDTLAGLTSAEALGMPVAPIRWTMADENPEPYVMLTLNELREVAVLLLTRGNRAHEYSRTLYNQIEDAGTPAALALVVWSLLETSTATG